MKAVIYVRVVSAADQAVQLLDTVRMWRRGANGNTWYDTW